MEQSLSQRTKIYQVGSETLQNVPHGRRRVRTTLPDRIVRSLNQHQFRPHRLFRNGHAQTIVACAWPRYLSIAKTDPKVEEHLFEPEPKVRLLAHCTWQTDRLASPTVVLVHGLEGSSDSKYMLGTAEKAWRLGFNTVRLNLRTCGGTEHLTPTLYHSGMTGDLRAVVTELIERDSLRSIFLIGFSMGGNMVLKFAGEDAAVMPTEVSGFCAVSPAVDLSSCAEAVKFRSNWLYEQYFLRSLCRRLRIKHELFPELYDTSDLHLVRTIKEFDERYIVHDAGFEDADDYYRRASALPLIERINKPTLIIHAQDDPFVPFEPLNHSSVIDNSHILLLAPKQGGHVGFVSDNVTAQDRFWSENRIVEFCNLVHQNADP